MIFYHDLILFASRYPGAILGVELKPDGRVLFTAHKDGLTFIQKERSVKPPVPLKNRPEENSLLDGAVPVTFQRPK